jgi:quinoprotein glucose dehydrogenase
LLVTAGGLVFTGPGDKKLYALDQENGRVVWSADLPHAAEGTPMTYRGRDGRQFVVIATGEGKEATLVAFALPEE